MANASEFPALWPFLSELWHTYDTDYMKWWQLQVYAPTPVQTVDIFGQDTNRKDKKQYSQSI